LLSGCLAHGVLATDIDSRSNLYLPAHRAEQNLALAKLLVNAVEISLSTASSSEYWLPISNLEGCAIVFGFD